MIKKPKKIIVVSFSGGETSALLLIRILKKYGKTHRIVVIFANTGEENEETLLFVHQVDEYIKKEFGHPGIVWVQFDIRPVPGKTKNTHRSRLLGLLKKRQKQYYRKTKQSLKFEPIDWVIQQSYKIVSYITAYRSHDPEEIQNKWPNHPFRKFISKYGIPNLQNFGCTRELKERAISRYLNKSGLFPRMYTLAIGIRADEIDRLGSHWYPLAIDGITKPMVNNFWSQMPFRLQLKGYEGNCKTCWKKSVRKLVTIYRKNPWHFEFMRQMEKEYGYFIPEGVDPKSRTLPARFFIQNRTVDDIAELAKDASIKDAKDDSTETSYQISLFSDVDWLDASNGCEESCEVKFE